MKKSIRYVFLPFIVAILFVAALLCFMPRDLTALIPEGKEYIVFCRNRCGTFNGIADEVHATYDNLRSVLYQCRYVDGVTVLLPSSTNVQTVVHRLGAKVVEIQRLPDMTIYLCHSKRVQGCVNVDEQKVNLQIAVTKSAVYVGSPLLLGSY